MSMDRRRFLEVSAATMLTACDSQGPASARPFLRHAESKNEGVERLLLRHTSMDRASRATLAGNAFPKYHISRETPIWDAAARGGWMLQVDGAVRNPVRLTLEQLSALPRLTQTVNNYCVEGWVAAAAWTGVRVSELAKVVRPTADAQYVDFASFDDGYHESWDMESAMHPQTLIAYGMDDRWLGPDHGAPARLHSPIKLGYKSTKYLVRVTFLPERNGGYWSDQGYEWFAGT
jgi:DMSO/TMAO reductase YedYZ molybdopterin-dependent catalytic subunit